MKTPHDEATAVINLKSDKLVDYFLAGTFAAGLLFAIYSQTFLLALFLGTFCVSIYYVTKYIFLRSNFYQYVLSAMLGVFMIQYLYQTHGMLQVYFFSFVASAMLVTYQNWRLQLPLAIIVSGWSIGFAVDGSWVAQTFGFQQEPATVSGTLLYLVLSNSVFFLCGWWAKRLRNFTENYTPKILTANLLQEVNLQKNELTLSMLELQQKYQHTINSKREFESFLSTLPDILFSINVIDKKIISMSAAVNKMLGYEASDFAADQSLWLKIVHPEDKSIVAEMYEKLVAGIPVCGQCRLIHRNKITRWVEIRITPLLTEGGRLQFINGIVTDITKRIVFEKKSALERKEQQLQLTGAAINAQENERSFLGERLHENINPILATAKLYLDCAMSAEDKRINLVPDSKKLINMAMSEIRNLSKSLLPPSLNDIPLTDALHEMIHPIKTAHNICFVTNWRHFDEQAIPDTLKLTIYRIAQEQLKNIVRHAKAGNVFIGLKQEEGRVVLHLKDDGVGFDKSEKGCGAGFQNMISRAALFNGTITINSGPGKGCELIITFYNNSAALAGNATGKSS